MSYNAFIQDNINHEFVPSMYLSATGRLVINDKIMQNNSKVFLTKIQKEISLESIIEIVCDELDVDREDLSLPEGAIKSAVRVKK